MAPTRGHQLFWASGPYSLFSALAGARCNDVIAFFGWCIRVWPTSLSLPNEDFVEGILDRDVFHIVSWFGRSIFALLYDDTIHEMLVC